MTASTAEAHPSRTSGSVRRASAAAVTSALAVVSAIAAFVLRDSDVNYDLAYALGWGRALADGDLPDYELAGAPTPHPLTTLLTTLADLVPFVDAITVMHVVAYASYAALVVCTALIAAELFSWLASVAAGVVVALSTPVLVNTAVAFQDAMTAAFVMLAVLLEVRSPRRGAAPLVALGAAGLLRPEAWGLAAAYWLWLGPGTTGRARLRFGALAAAAPLLWVLTDLLITGEPLFSFTHTRAGAEEAARVTGLSEAPTQLFDNLRHAVGRGALAGGILGAAFAAFALWRRRGGRSGPPEVDPRAGVPLATLVLLGGAFLALGLSELSLLERYVIGPAALLTVFLGLAITAWRYMPSRGLVVVATVIAALLAVDTARGIRAEFTRLGPIMDAVRTEDDVLTDLRALSGEIERLGARCGTIAVSSYRTRPYLAYELGVEPRDLVRAESETEIPARSVYVAPASKRARDGFTLLGRDGGPLPPPPAGFRRAAGNASWAAYARGC